MSYSAGQTGPVKDPEPPRQEKIWKWVGLAFSGSLLFLALSLLIRFVIPPISHQLEAERLQQRAKEFVNQQRSSAKLPVKINDEVTLTDIRLEPGGAHFYYMLSPDSNGAFLAEVSLRSLVIPDACSDPVERKAIETGLDVKYTFSFAGGKTFDFLVTKTDCLPHDVRQPNAVVHF